MQVALQTFLKYTDQYSNVLIRSFKRRFWKVKIIIISWNRQIVIYILNQMLLMTELHGLWVGIALGSCGKEISSEPFQRGGCL